MNENIAMPVEKFAFSPDDAAHISSVSRTRIYAEIKSGRLVARKAGKQTVITADDLKSWLNALPTRI
jgi:hypothetical protein